jgi:hypothetical protein
VKAGCLSSGEPIFSDRNPGPSQAAAQRDLISAADGCASPINDGIAQHADIFDLHLDHVSGLEED